MSWTSGEAPEAVNGLELQLAQGRVLVEGLVIGADPSGGPSAAARNEGLAIAGGGGYLVASSRVILPGFVRVQLPEPAKVTGKK